MSGGHFDYNQDRIRDIADTIEHDIERNEYEYSPETIARMQECVKVLRKAYVYARRIDWLMSGDDGEESFHRRLKEELSRL